MPARWEHKATAGPNCLSTQTVYNSVEIEVGPPACLRSETISERFPEQSSAKHAYIYQCLTPSFTSDPLER
jgi:hypothetical protein